MNRHLALTVGAAMSVLLLLIGATFAAPTPHALVPYTASSVSMDALDTNPAEPTVTPNHSTGPSPKAVEANKIVKIPHWVKVWMSRLFSFVIAGIAAWVLWNFLKNRKIEIGAARTITVAKNAEDIGILDEQVAADDLERAVLQAQDRADDVVVQAWLQLENTAAASGVRRKATETTSDYTRRVLASTNVDAAAVEQLGELYREVVFSNHTRRPEIDKLAHQAVTTIVTTLRQGTAHAQT